MKEELRERSLFLSEGLYDLSYARQMASELSKSNTAEELDRLIRRLRRGIRYRNGEPGRKRGSHWEGKSAEEKRRLEGILRAAERKRMSAK